MDTTVVLGCGCTSNGGGNPNGARFQDSRYGPGMRVHNFSVKANVYVCTVCGKRHGTEVKMKVSKKEDNK